VQNPLSALSVTDMIFSVEEKEEAEVSKKVKDTADKGRSMNAMKEPPEIF
jgi:hypothetical protein